MTQSLNQAFVFESEIGRGGMGRVFSGYHISTHTAVVLKTLTTQKALHTPELFSVFRQEAHAAATLYHPGIVHTYDYGVLAESLMLGDESLPSGSPFIVMEHVASPSLRTQSLPMRGEDVFAVLMGVMEALAHAHARHIIHRDLKPSNIMFDPVSGEIVLIDFGLASMRKTLSEQRSGGTPLYMAPEQFSLEHDWGEGPWTDLYALGCLAFELVVGYPPFLSADRATLFQQKQSGQHQPWPSNINAPEGFESWVEALLTREPEDRIKHIAQARTHFLALGDVAAWSVTRPTAQSTTQDTRKNIEQGAQSLFMPLDAFASSSLLLMPAFVSTTRPHDVSITSSTFERPDLTPLMSDEIGPGPAPRDVPLMDTGLGILSHRATGILGRDEEMASLWSSLNRAMAARTCQNALIRGFSGMGKSALMRAVEQRAYEQAAISTVDIRFEPDTPLSIVLTNMWNAFFDGHALDRAAIFRRMVRRLNMIDGRGEQFAQSLIDIVRPQHAALDAKEQWRRTITALKAIATHQPLIILLDDVQWWRDAEQGLSSLNESLKHESVFIMMTLRNEDIHDRPLAFQWLSPWSMTPNAKVIELAPLSKRAQSEVVRQLLCFDQDVVDALCERTGGSPFFAVQLVRDWVMRGVLISSGAGFMLAQQEMQVVPDLVHDVCMRRLAFLADDPQCALVLERLALLGTQTSHPQWKTLVAPLELDASRVLSTLTRRGIIEEARAGVRFTHHIIRESALMLEHTAASRQRAHGDCARVFESGAERNSTAAMAWHHHLLMSGAQEHFYKSLINAIHLITFEDAFAMLERTEAQLVDPTELWRIRLLRCRATIHANHMNTEVAMALVQSMMEGLEGMHGEDAVYLRQSAQCIEVLCNVHNRDVQHGIALAESIFKDASVLNQPLSQKMHCSLLMNLAELFIADGQLSRALVCLEQAKLLISTVWDEAWLLYGFSNAYIDMMRMDDALRTCQEAEALFEQMQDPLGLAACMMVRGTVLVHQHQFSEALHCFERCMIMYNAIGDGGAWFAFEGVIQCLIVTDQMPQAAQQMAEVEARIAQGEEIEIYLLHVEVACAAYREDWDNMVKILARFREEHDPEYIDVLVIMILERAGEFAAPFDSTTFNEDLRAAIRWCQGILDDRADALEHHPSHEEFSQEVVD